MPVMLQKLKSSLSKLGSDVYMMLDKGLVDVKVIACSHLSLSNYVNSPIQLEVTTILIKGLVYLVLFS